MALSVATASGGCALKSSDTPTAVASGKPVEYMKMKDNYEPAPVESTDEPSPYFVLDGKPFCFAGTNNYYLSYKSEEAVLDVLETAVAMELRVVRMWGFLDRGSLDGAVRNIREPGHQEGVYFHYWDPKAQRPAYNDGPDGLQRLDFVLHHARRLGIKLVLVLTNGWRDFGGMDQYLVWYGLEQHHLFYTDERVRQAYKNWVTHIVSRTNTIDGTPYRDDPAIFAWELANEPRTMISEDFDSHTGWDTTTITKWADEMSAHVKSLDQNHMVSVGDEGFLASGRKHWAYESPHGVDHEQLTALEHVDFGTFHLYPDHWGTGHRWGINWIEDHIAVGRRVDKPTVLEEYGIHVRREQETAGAVVSGWERRKVAYVNWNNVALLRGGAGTMFWILSGMEAPGKLYPDYDHFTVYRDDESYELLRGYARRFRTQARACELAKSAEHGPSTPFVSVRSAPPGIGDGETLPSRPTNPSPGVD